MAGEVYVSVSGLEQLESSLAQTSPLLDRFVSENNSNIKRTREKIDQTLDSYNARMSAAYQKYQQAAADLEYAQRTNEDGVPDYFYTAVRTAELEYYRLKDCCTRIKNIRTDFCEQAETLQRTTEQDAETYSTICKKGGAFIEKYSEVVNRSNRAINNGSSIGGSGSYSRTSRIGAGALAVAEAVAGVGASVIPANNMNNGYGDTATVPAVYTETVAPLTPEQTVKHYLPAGYEISNPGKLPDLFENIHHMAEAVADAKKRKDKQDETGELINALHKEKANGNIL